MDDLNMFKLSDVRNDARHLEAAYRQFFEFSECDGDVMVE
jgi:hypothetical protein